MKNKLLGIILWIVALLIIADVIGLGSLLYGVIIKNSIYNEIELVVIVMVLIMYMVIILPFYVISKLMND